jgi:hypothetical protein
MDPDQVIRNGSEVLEISVRTWRSVSILNNGGMIFQIQMGRWNGMGKRVGILSRTMLFWMGRLISISRNLFWSVFPENMKS